MQRRQPYACLVVSTRNAVAAVLVALVVGVVVGAVGASAWPRPVVTLPSPSPAPTATVSTPTPIPTFTLLPTTPTPSPTNAPTPPPPPIRTKQPQPTSRTAGHEIGHYYEAMLNRKDASIDWRSKYWAFRGFPGTWQQAAAEAATLTGMAQWIHQPQESWAEAFSIAMVGGGQEKTLDYGRTINPSATKAFFMSLLN